MPSPAIVQFAPYIYPLGVSGPANIPLSNAPTAGNVLIGAVPLDYVIEGFPVDPYWTLFLAQADFNLPMNWFGHVVQPGESADLPPFYDGLVSPDFAQYVGGAVWELSGASSDFTTIVGAYNEATNGGATLALPALTSLQANTLMLGFALGNCDNGPTPPPWLTIAIDNDWTQQFIEPSDLQEDQNVYSYLAGSLPVAAAASSVTFTATYSGADDPPFLAMVSAVSIGPAVLAKRVISPNAAIALPCIPCCMGSTKLPF